LRLNALVILIDKSSNMSDSEDEIAKSTSTGFEEMRLIEGKIICAED